MTQFNGLLSNNRRNIRGNFNTIEKAVEFIKTEKELYDNIGKVIEKLKERQASMRAIQKEIITITNCQPTVQDKYYLNEDIDGEPIYMDYMLYDLKNKNDVDNVDEPKTTPLTNFTVEGISEVQKKTDDMESGDSFDDETKMKMKYNDLARKICRLQSKIDSLEFKKRNLKQTSSRTHKLNQWELEQYGF